MNGHREVVDVEAPLLMIKNRVLMPPCIARWCSVLESPWEGLWSHNDLGFSTYYVCGEFS